MLKDIGFSLGQRFSTTEKDNPMSFHLDCLSNSTQLDLLLGYFSSSAISMLSLGFATFLYNGGKVRMAINHILSSSDRDAFIKGTSGDIMEGIIDLSDIKGISEKLDAYDRHFFECIAWLIANKKIEFVIIQPKEGNGIAHYKEGIYYDENDQVGFNGSMNFTANGLAGNLESLECLCSWLNGDNEKLKIKKKFIDNILEERDNKIYYLDVSQVIENINDEFGGKDLRELLEVEKELLKAKREALSKNEKLTQKIQNLEEIIEYYDNMPRFPYPSGPRDYQIEAYNKWVENGKQGLFAMATGTGKTLTALNCLLNEYHEQGNYRAIIVVPTIALLKQWGAECKEFNFKNIFEISNSSKYESELQDHLFYSKYNNSSSYIIIVTYASFTRSKFKTYLNSLIKDTLFIADEAHNLGSNSCRELLRSLELKKRIGLSATPTRQFDEIGNNSIGEFFNDASPYCYSYSLEEAITNGILCKYLYYPYIVELTEVEMDEYVSLSKDLMRYFDAKNKKFKQCKEVEILLLKRKRIIHKAENKLEVFSKIIDIEYKRQGNNLNYTLIYAPEGNEDYTKIEEGKEDDSDALINSFNRVLLQLDSSIIASKFTAQTESRDFILEEFKQGRINVLTSMKCLDEGVDIPRTEVAVFCASTGNPRQFVQRRGRVLRQHKDKNYAIIYDLVVIPKISVNYEYYEYSKNMIKKELERVKDFSELSMNPNETHNVLEDVLNYYDLNLYN